MARTLKSLPFPSTAAFSRFSFCTLSIPLESAAGSSLDDDVETVYKVITSSTSVEDLRDSLRTTPILLSNDLIDKVLKRFRFGHGNPLQALEFYKYTDRRKGFYHSPSSLNTLLYVLGRCRRYDLIWELLGETRRKDRSLLTPHTVQVVLGRIAKVCSLKMTVESFWKMKKLVPDFNVECYNALLRSLCQEKSMSDARKVYHSLKRNFKPNLQTFNILLSGWKSSAEAEMFFQEMWEMGVRPDVVSYNSMIDVYCKGWEIEKAYNLIQRMEEEGVIPDVITYTSIIGGLGLIGKPDRAREVLKEMTEHGCPPDAAAYNAAIRNYCIAKRIGDAFGLMNEMKLRGVPPNRTTYNLFFRVFYWSNDLQSSWAMYERMMGEACFPNTQTCMFLLRLCQRQEKTATALRIWNDMVEKGFGAYSLASGVLLDMLCDMGMVDDAVKCFLQMAAKGQKPSHASFNRIRVLLELVGKHDTIRKLSHHMGSPVV